MERERGAKKPRPTMAQHRAAIIRTETVTWWLESTTKKSQMPVAPIIGDTRRGSSLQPKKIPSSKRASSTNVAIQSYSFICLLYLVVVITSGLSGMFRITSHVQ